MVWVAASTAGIQGTSIRAREQQFPQPQGTTALPMALLGPWGIVVSWCAGCWRSCLFRSSNGKKWQASRLKNNHSNWSWCQLMMKKNINKKHIMIKHDLTVLFWTVVHYWERKKRGQNAPRTELANACPAWSLKPFVMFEKTRVDVSTQHSIAWQEHSIHWVPQKRWPPKISQKGSKHCPCKNNCSIGKKSGNIRAEGTKTPSAMNSGSELQTNCH